MKQYLHIILIPLGILVMASIGGFITSNGMDWYDTIQLPSWTPDGSFIGTVWTTIFILFAIAGIWAWPRLRGNRIWWVLGFFVLNGVLNVLWSYIFFGVHNIGLAVIEAGLLGLSVLVIIGLLWPVSRVAALLFVPYAGWVCFATYLTYMVWQLNM